VSRIETNAERRRHQLVRFINNESLELFLVIMNVWNVIGALLTHKWVGWSWFYVVAGAFFTYVIVRDWRRTRA
jgi:hypothetical protein